MSPILTLCLIFDQTKDLFRKWLMYGIGTLFSMSVFSVVTAMAMELMAKISIVLWVAKLTSFLTGSTYNTPTHSFRLPSAIENSTYKKAE